VNALRFLRPECIRIPLDTVPSEAAPEENEAQRARRLAHEKESVLHEIADLLVLSGQVANANKLYRDLDHRERKSTTAIAPGIALPHVRTMQVKGFVMGFALARGEGIHFASLDGRPTRLFFLMASPPYEDRLYLQVYREMGMLLRDEDIVYQLLAAKGPQDVFNTLRVFLTQ
jgi:fructose PTS system EIIBC or EIIC component